MSLASERRTPLPIPGSRCLCRWSVVPVLWGAETPRNHGVLPGGFCYSDVETYIDSLMAIRATKVEMQLGMMQFPCWRAI